MLSAFMISLSLAMSPATMQRACVTGDANACAYLDARVIDACMIDDDSDDCDAYVYRDRCEFVTNED